MIVLAIILLVLAAGALALTIKERDDFERREKANIAIEEEIKKAIKTLNTREDVLNRREASLIKKEETLNQREIAIKKKEEDIEFKHSLIEQDRILIAERREILDNMMMDGLDLEMTPTFKKLAKREPIGIKRLLSEY